MSDDEWQWCSVDYNDGVYNLSFCISSITLIKPRKCSIGDFDFDYNDVDFHLEKTVEEEEEEGGEGRHCQPANQESNHQSTKYQINWLSIEDL